MAGHDSVLKNDGFQALCGVVCVVAIIAAIVLGALYIKGENSQKAKELEAENFKTCMGFEIKADRESCIAALVDSDEEQRRYTVSIDGDEVQVR